MEWVIGASPDIDHHSKWRSVLAKLLSMTVLMLLIVGLRFWVRRKDLHREDWVTLVTAMFSITYCASSVIQTRFGLGLPMDLRPEEDQKDYAIINYTSRPFYLWGIAGFKLSLCLMYLRMTKRSLDTRYRWFIIGVAVFSVMAQTVFVFVFLFSCIPLSKTFDPSINGSCIPYAPVSYTMSGITILCDVVIFLIPIPLIYRLRLERAVKLGLTIIFSLGLLTTVCSILRLEQIHRIAHGDGDSTQFVVRSAMELNVGIITSCLPVLRPFLKHIPRKLLHLLPFSSTRRNTTASSQSTPQPTLNCLPLTSLKSSHAPTNSVTCLAGSAPIKPPTSHRSKLSAAFKNSLHRTQPSISEEQIIEIQRPEDALTRSESHESWRNSGVLKTVEVDVESSYVLSPSSGEGASGDRGDRGMVTRWEWE